MTAIRAHRVGCLPRGPQGNAAPSAGFVGPDLPAAACKGRWPLFDDRVDGETADYRTKRHARAVAICRGCPEFARCLDARHADPGLGAGVWGGRVFHGPRKCRCGAPIPPEAHPLTLHCTPKCRNTRRGLNPSLRAGECETCGTGFVTSNPNRRYCNNNDKCRRDGTPRPDAIRYPALDRCQGCNKPLTQGRGRPRRNCSKKCRRRAGERRARYRAAA